MNKPDKFHLPVYTQSRWGAAISLIFALTLLTTLFPVEQPRMISNHTWRTELFTTLFLFVVILVSYWYDRSSLTRIFALDELWLRTCILSFAAFAIWGFLSAFWSPLPYSAWHHTIVWSEYLMFFLIARDRFSNDRNIALITGTFMSVAALIGVLCLIDYVTLPEFSNTLEGTLRARYSANAELLITAMPVVWVAAAYARKKSSYWVMQLSGIAGWMVIMLSLSKGAFIAGIIGFAVMFIGILFFGNRQFRLRIVTSAGIWLVVTVCVQIGFSLLTPIPATVDYISGKMDATRDTSLARIFLWQVGSQMVSDNWLYGVGADNFGVSFNKSRESYRDGHPDEPKDEIVSDFLVERAHNEFLQITAELGTFGLLLVAIPLILFAMVLFRTFYSSRFVLSPMLWAAIGGMTAFGISSMVSSFSLRIVQNGIVFFLVFAIAVNEMSKTRRRHPALPGKLRRLTAPVIFAALSVLFGAMISTLLLKGVAEYYVSTANRETDKDIAVSLYERALKLDPDYQAAHLLIAGRSYIDKDYEQAASRLRKAIDGGLGVVITYNALADNETKLGNLKVADDTFKESLSIFPRSVFQRVRYALFLREAGRDPESQKQTSAAREIDAKQASGWYYLLTMGSVAAFYASEHDPTIAPPVALRPEAAVYQYLDKTPDNTPK